MTDKNPTAPPEPPALPYPTAPLEPFREAPGPAAQPPRDVAYPPRPIPSPAPYPAQPLAVPGSTAYPAAPHFGQQGYAAPAAPPMPIISVVQNNAVGAGPIMVHRGTNHGLHLLLTLLTCGLWLPVWLLLVVIEAMNRK